MNDVTRQSSYKLGIMLLKLIVVALITAVSIGLATNKAWAVDYTTSGTFGGVDWVIADEVLTISPSATPEADFESGVIPNSTYGTYPWKSYSDPRWGGLAPYTSIVVASGVSTSQDCEGMFSDYQRYQSVISITFADDFDTSKATNMRQMFAAQEHLQSLVLPESFNTSHVADMSYMFSDLQACVSIESNNRIRAGSRMGATNVYWRR